MTPALTHRPAFLALGILRHGDDPHTTDYEAIWREFMPHEAAVKALSTDDAYYGIGFCGGEGEGFEYLAGMAVEGVCEAPEGLVLLEIPEAPEAVFECSVATIGDTYAFAYNEWLPGSELECAEPLPWIEKYLPGEGEGAELGVEIHIAVRKKVV